MDYTDRKSYSNWFYVRGSSLNDSLCFAMCFQKFVDCFFSPAISNEMENNSLLRCGLESDWQLSILHKAALQKQNERNAQHATKGNGLKILTKPTCSCFHFILNIIITDFSFIKYLIINTSIFFSLFSFRVSIWVKMLQCGVSKQLRF